MQLNIQEILDALIGKHLLLTKIKYKWKYWESDRKNSKSASVIYTHYHTVDVDIEIWEEYVNKYIHSSKNERTKHFFIEKSLEKYKILSIDTFRNEDDESAPTLEIQLEGFSARYFFITLDQTFEVE